MGLGSEGVVSRALPQGFADQLAAPPRLSKYRELVCNTLVPNMQALNDEGSYFVATSAVGTASTFDAVTTTFSDLKAGLALINKDAVGGKRIYLDFIKLLFTTAPTTVTTPFWNYAFRIDNVQARFTSNSGVTPTPVSPNMDTGSSTICTVQLGPIVTATATAAARTVGRGVMRGVQPVVNDTIMFVFGGVEKSVGAQSLALATATTILVHVAPVIIGPNAVLSLHQWGTGMGAAGSCELEMGWWER
jgi:hypothetical protein